MTTVRSLAEDLDLILKSFGSMLEGVYHIDEDLAGELAEKFSIRLQEQFRQISSEMMAEISAGLQKPPKKTRKRKTKQEMTSLAQVGMDDEAPDRAIGMEELPDNENTLLHADNEGDADLLAERMLNNTRVTDRGNRGGGNSSTWDTENPTMRRIGR